MIFNFILLFIIVLYETHTHALLNLFIEETDTENELMNKKFNGTDGENGNCERKIKLADYDELPIVFLNSFPGSGNT